jgi:hypothetical protein
MQPRSQQKPRPWTDAIGYGERSLSTEGLLGSRLFQVKAHHVVKVDVNANAIQMQKI